MNCKQRIIARKIEQELSIKNGVIRIDEISCDGCGKCIDVCPQTAIKMITLSDDQIKKLPFKGRLKVKIKGKKKAFLYSDLCIACGLCMKECHEFAIHKVEIN
ncbi:4Fe-4S dicluster domain-containing protein [Marinifilum sp. RC60d5]|uniref:4Fe-4S dicluster domain-containing protein n=1 Tax=Marinifilum sp. RC60d5 TaxID=3458414 RepID=UPI00403500D2